MGQNFDGGKFVTNWGSGKFDELYQPYMQTAIGRKL